MTRRDFNRWRPWMGYVVLAAWTFFAIMLFSAGNFWLALPFTAVAIGYAYALTRG